jgi:hypothetical protein
MWRYATVAAAAKAFSANRATRYAYRRLGNTVLDRIRSGAVLPAPYLDRARHLVSTCDRYGILQPGEEVLEVGTGWIHWEATVLRLFYDIDVTLYDVCDNRLFRTYRAWLAQLRAALPDWPLEPGRIEQAVALADRALAAESFAELYETLRFTYRLDPSGALAGVPAGRFSLVTSADVLEHVDAAALPGFLDAMRATLRPGGYSVHQIDLADHYAYFDADTSPKNYYRYSDLAWRRWFESGVQYFNRLQCPTWRALFDRAGFQPVEERLISAPLGELPLAADYRNLSRSDLECLQMRTVHRTPAGRDPGGTA